jgi:hypothetical protein
MSSNQSSQAKQAPNMDPLDARKIKWEYVVPIVATPVAHMFVSLIRRYPQHKKKLIYGVIVSTVLTVQTRLILMYDAGYPGAEQVYMLLETLMLHVNDFSIRLIKKVYQLF